MAMLSGATLLPYRTAMCLRRQMVTMVMLMSLLVIGFNIWHFRKEPHMMSRVFVPPSDILRYEPASHINYGGKAGQRLHVAMDTLRHLGIPYVEFPKIDMETLDQFVFATAASSNHFQESLDAVASVQQYFPNKQIYYYDLGLEESEIAQVHTWCGVTYRKFRFSKYPDHVRELKNYAWKPLIVQDVLREEVGVFWMDSSIRLFSNNLTSAMTRLQAGGGLAIMKEVAHSNFVVVHPGMFEYLPCDQAMQRVTSHSAATTFMAYRGRAVYWGVLHWWFVCALDPACISPVSKQPCLNKKDVLHGNEFSGCHRFDQAALNLLASNHFHYKTELYTIGRKTGFLVIQKHITNDYVLKLCSS